MVLTHTSDRPSVVALFAEEDHAVVNLIEVKGVFDTMSVALIPRIDLESIPGLVRVQDICTTTRFVRMEFWESEAALRRAWSSVPYRSDRQMLRAVLGRNPINELGELVSITSR